MAVRVLYSDSAYIELKTERVKDDIPMFIGLNILESKLLRRRVLNDLKRY